MEGHEVVVDRGEREYEEGGGREGVEAKGVWNCREVWQTHIQHIDSPFAVLLCSTPLRTHY